MIKLKHILRETEEFQQLPSELKKHFLEIISTYGQHREGMSRKSDIMQIAETLGGIADAAQEYTLREGGDWFDRVTIKRNMNELKKLQAGFEKEAVDIQDFYLEGKKAEAAAAIPGEWIMNANLVGSTGFIKERVAAFKESGVTVLSVNPIGPDPVGQVEKLRAIIDG